MMKPPYGYPLVAQHCHATRAIGGGITRQSKRWPTGETEPVWGARLSNQLAPMLGNLPLLRDQIALWQCRLSG
eukprot:7024926-Lingulodinium_polyedra.AAC.1